MYMSKITEFYNFTGTDQSNRNLLDYFQFNDYDMETFHDWVQWAFPTNEASMFNKDAPLLKISDVDQIPRIIVRLLVAKYKEFLERESYVIFSKSMNHNYLRITRVLKFLKLMGLDELHSTLQTMWCEIGESQNVFPEVIKIWRSTKDYSWETSS